MDYGSDIQGDKQKGRRGRVASKKGLLQWIQASPPSYRQARTG